jgi:hypothetical protein
LQENPAGFEAFDHFDTIEEETSIPSFAAAQTAAAAAATADAPAGQDSVDLMAAADEALATAAADSVLSALPSPNATPQSSLEEAPSSPASAEFPCARRRSSIGGGSSASAFAAAVPSTLRSGSEESVSLQALQGLQVIIVYKQVVASNPGSGRCEA